MEPHRQYGHYSETVGTWQSARILALVNFALADGYIAGFAAKYRFNFWRPITAIHMAALDGNALTNPDPSWNSFCVNPPVPDHPSTHTVLGAAAAEVLIQNFGNRVPFSTTSASLPNVTRHYRGFTEAAVENGMLTRLLRNPLPESGQGRIRLGQCNRAQGQPQAARAPRQLARDKLVRLYDSLVSK